jgi:hypothetical protein
LLLKRGLNIYILEAPSKLVNDRVVVGDRLVVHGPAAADDFQLARFDQTFDFVPNGLGLLIPPLTQVRRFHVDKPFNYWQKMTQQR